jgi:hypothetical protein
MEVLADPNDPDKKL